VDVVETDFTFKVLERELDFCLVAAVFRKLKIRELKFIGMYVVSVDLVEYALQEGVIIFHVDEVLLELLPMNKKIKLLYAL